MKELSVQNLKVAVFDWDNTLAQSREPLLFCISQVLKKFNLPEWEIVKEQRDNNLSFRDNFKNIFGINAEKAYEMYRQLYLKCAKNMIASYPKAKEVLEFFKNRNILVMVMSNKDRKLLEYELPLIFPPEIFDNIVCGHEAPADKPSGQHLLYTLKNVMKKEEINSDNVWVIGDSPHDNLCAQNAGARAIRIGHDIWDNDDLLQNVTFFASFADFYDRLVCDN